MLLSSILLLMLASYASSIDYYWKDYFGKIPDDAYPAGLDTNNHTLYIAQAYLEFLGIIVTWLPSGDQKSVTVPSQWARRSEFGIKVLCTQSPEKLSWLKTNCTTFNANTKDKHLVRGGIQHCKTLHIGRVWSREELLVGKIYEFWNGHTMFYVQGNRIRSAEEYEVLVYDDEEPEGITAASALIPSM